MMMNRLSENIKLIRKQKWKLSQDRFAQLLNSSRSKINSYENSGVEPSIFFMVQLQNLTGIPISNIYSLPIPIDSIPSEPIEDIKSSQINSFTSTVEGEKVKYLSTYEEMIEKKIFNLESRIDKIEEKIEE